MAHSTTPAPSSAILDNLLSQSDRSAATPEHRIACCCHRSDCISVEHNQASIGSLHRDLQQAAHIGQVRPDSASPFPRSGSAWCRAVFTDPKACRH